MLILQATVARAASPRDYCRGTKAVQTPSIFYVADIPKIPAGTPLDIALRTQELEIEKARQKARSAFLENPPPALARAIEDYTFLTPKSERDTYGLGDLVPVTEISEAIKYRHFLWKSFIKEFSTVREAPSEDGSTSRFQVSLDLSYFCRYGRRIEDLVTRN